MDLMVRILKISFLQNLAVLWRAFGIREFSPEIDKHRDLIRSLRTLETGTLAVASKWT